MRSRKIEIKYLVVKAVRFLLRTIFSKCKQRLQILGLKVSSPHALKETADYTDDLVSVNLIRLHLGFVTKLYARFIFRGEVLYPQYHN